MYTRWKQGGILKYTYICMSDGVRKAKNHLDLNLVMNVNAKRKPSMGISAVKEKLGNVCTHWKRGQGNWRQRTWKRLRYSMLLCHNTHPWNWPLAIPSPWDEPKVCKKEESPLVKKNPLGNSCTGWIYTSLLCVTGCTHSWCHCKATPNYLGKVMASRRGFWEL